MKTFYQKISLLVCLASCFLLAAAQGQPAGTRVAITAITPSLNTGQNYAPWLNDDLNDLVQSEWSAANQQYIDVTLTLAHPTNITRLSLYDHQGTFADKPVSLYALNGTQRTLLGVFTGEAYQQWVTIAVSTPVEATALVVHKYGNNIPQKIQVFGLPIQAVISFAPLPNKMEGSAPFDLVATSNNPTTPITFASSNPTVVAVSNASGRWQATVGSVGSATITASQAASATYLAAADVVQPQVVQVAATSGTGKLPIEPQRWYQLTSSPDGIQALFDGATDANVRPGYGKLVSPHDSYYALRAGETFTIESVKFYDYTGMDPAKPFTLSILTDTWQRIPIATFFTFQNAALLDAGS